MLRIVGFYETLFCMRVKWLYTLYSRQFSYLYVGATTARGGSYPVAVFKSTPYTQSVVFHQPLWLQTYYYKAG